MVKGFLALALLLSFAPVSEAASLSRRCDPVWEVAQPVYKRVKGKLVRVGYRCVTRQPNGGGDPHGSGGHGG